MEVELWKLASFVVGGLLAGAVDSIGGGGGLISVPLLLGFGLDPASAFGTNKAQAIFGTTTAARHYVRSGVADLQECRLGIAFAIAGSGIGAWSVSYLDAAVLKPMVPALLIGFALFLLVRPRYGVEPAPPRMSRSSFYPLFGFLLGFYDGFFGPGTGTFWVFALTGLLGRDLRQATGQTKIFNATSNLVALGMFVMAGKVVWIVAASMALGQLAGARFGADLVVRRGARFVRPVLLTVALGTSAKLLWELIQI